MNSLKKPEHLNYADAMRVCSVIAVVLIHVSGIRLDEGRNFPRAAWWTSCALDSFSRWCVPVFIMLSGALLLDPARKESVREFFKKRMMRVFVPLVFWSIFYFLWKAFYDGEPLSVQYTLNQLRLGMPAFHLYFLFIILGLYFFVPALRWATPKLPRAGLILLTLGLFAASSIVLISGSVEFNLLTRPPLYLGYFLAGFILRDPSASRKAALGTLALFILLSCFTTIQTGRMYLSGDPNLWMVQEHLYPVIIFQSLSAFLLLKGLGFAGARLQKFFQIFGPSAFGIYIVHIVILDLVRRWTYRIQSSKPFTSLAAEFLLTLVLSAGSVVLLRKLRSARFVLGG